jgi:acylphosphatase
MRVAEGLKLRGWARNLPDGSVEVVSEGPEAALEELEQQLRRGPSYARVDEMQRLQGPLEVEIPRSFEIR